MKTLTVKKLFFVTVLTSVVTLIPFVGCGGSGGGGGSTVASTLDKASVQKMAQNILEEGNCVAISGLGLSPSLYNTNNPTQDNPKLNLRTYGIDRTINGLISGTLRKHGEHNNGTDTLTYDFSNFTNPTGNLKFGLNGSASVIDYGKPGDYGPIKTKKTIATKGALSATKSSNTRQSATNYELKMSGYAQTYAKVLFSPDDLIIRNASAKNTTTNKEYSISNLSAKGFFSNDQIALIDLKTKFTDPEVGTVDVISDKVVVSRDSVQLPSSLTGTFTLTASDGTKAQTVVAQSGNIKIYTLKGDTKTLVSELDCSGLVH